ncbi:VCBS repeat-containing protein [Bradyrhizobium sp. 21]|nr:VCBS repeat-containing protein [Bradyrhizobium sp. 21]
MSLPGSFAVSPTGGATYSIPIALPPGTAGMAPSLSLEYGSQGPNGLLGVGWSLSGLPVITRCPQTKVQDGVVGGVNFDANDRYCMDGQRLTALSGAYGADGTQYRTEVESYSKIISHGTSGNGPAWFEVHTKSGQTMEFGNTTDSRVLAQGKASARVWALNKVSDTKTNYYTVSYVLDPTKSEFYPVRIDYTGNATAGLSAYNSVQFIYASRSDNPPRYEAGSLIQTDGRLTNVKTYSGSSLVTNYQLAYQLSSSTGRSEIISVTACAADGSCLPATTFQWTGSGSVAFSGGGGLNPSSWDFGTPPASLRAPLSGDFNGDGKLDVMMFSNDGYYLMLANGDGSFSGQFSGMPNGWDFGTPPQSMRTPLTGDFNGDGKTDIIMLSNDAYYMMLNNGNGTFSGTVAAYPTGSNFGSKIPNSNFFMFPGDYNGDGCADFSVIGGTSFWTFLSKCDGTFTGSIGALPNSWNFGAPVFPSSGSVVSNALQGMSYRLYSSSQWASFPGDFDGDGITDIAFFGGTGYAVLLSKGDGTFKSGVSGTYALGSNFGAQPTSTYTPFIGDFNGDGKTDLVFMSGSYQWVFMCKGDGTFGENVNATPNSWNFGAPVSNNFVIDAGDFNGDGMSDLLLAGDSFYYVLTSNGNGTFTAGASNAYPYGQIFSAPPSQSWAVFSGDFTGSGKSGLVLFRDHSNSVFTVPGPAGDKITSITAGLGATVTVTYDTLTHSAVYTKGTGATYPVQELQAPIYVVSRVDTSNGVGGVYSSSYTYSSARLHAQGRGFLGFAQTSVKDLQTGIADTTTYRQDFPFIGLVSSTKRALGTQTLGQSTNTYQSYDTGGTAPYHVYLTQNVSSGADLDGSVLPTVTTSNQYDAYLNATQVTVSTPDGFSKTTNNTYTNDPSLWYLGRLTRATVTNVAP